jgi:hypothetical protein
MKFVSRFKETYERTTRNDGTKPVQCFPNCGEGGHKQNTFCGAPILVLQSCTQQIGDIYVGHIRVFWRCVSEQFGDTLQRGEELCKTSLLSKCHQDAFTEKSGFIQGKTNENGNVVEFTPVINLADDTGGIRGRKGWHYDRFVDKKCNC